MAAKKAKRRSKPAGKAEPKTAHHKRSTEFRRVLRTLAGRLRSHREERGWTIDQASEAFGVEPMSIWRLESGEANPTLATLVSIASALKVPVSELLAER